MSLKSKFALAGAALAAPLAAFATDPETTPLEHALSDLKNGATGLIDQVIPVIAGVLVAAFAMVGIYFAYRQIRKAIGR